MEDDELERIRARKFEALMRSKEGGGVGSMISGPISVTDGSLDGNMDEHEFFVLDCWAIWCSPCRAIAPIIEDLAKIYEGRIVFGKLNVDENPKTTARFNVTSIPTLLLFKEGELIDRIIGAVPRNDIEAILRKYLQ